MKRILIVDDDMGSRESFVAMLQGTYQTATAPDGAEAQILIKQAQDAGTSFDLIITDTNMPRVGGSALIEWVRSNGIDIPCILMSAGPNPGFHRANLFIGKLTSVTKIRDIVAQILSQEAKAVSSA